jgi:TraY domain
VPRKAVTGGTGKRVALNMKTTEATRAKLEQAAAASGRSLTAEVEYRLEQSFVQKELFDMVITQLRMAFDKEDALRASLDQATERMTRLEALLREECEAREARVTFPLIPVERMELVEPPRTSKKRKTEKT